VDHALGGNPQNGGYVSVGPDATLTLDSGATNTYIANRLSPSIVSNSTVNLNYSGNPDTAHTFPRFQKMWSLTMVQSQRRVPGNRNRLLVLEN
jgi:hypothetical protein